ncbi:hypothetical protein AB6A40_004150 [Gnathostoma spinigerum]|uniref:Uncharacterized protein n=1 Tax=Gnathostoma spinigerum TaxID=75299 RepID=A0ABD6EJ61_9BILA
MILWILNVQRMRRLVAVIRQSCNWTVETSSKIGFGPSADDALINYAMKNNMDIYIYSSSSQSSTSISSTTPTRTK